jgi:PTS system nitrogen regulatory IIA component
LQLTVRQVATWLRVPDATVRKWIREHGLPAVLFDEQYRLNRIDVLVWAQAHRVTVPQSGPGAPEPVHVRMAAALALGGIHRGVPGGRPAEVVREALARIPLPKGADRAVIEEIAVAREQYCRMSATSGIGIPHARFPTIAPVAEPLLALCFLEPPVDYGARDRVPVAALFVLVAPTIRIHLALLSRLTHALGTDFAALVQARASDQRLQERALELDLVLAEPQVVGLTASTEAPGGRL